MTESWRNDPDLVRQKDEDELQRVVLSPEWEQLFEVISSMFIGQGGGMLGKAQRVVLKGLAWQARKRVAEEPDEARAFVRDSVQMIAASLRIEPLELFPDWKPAANQDDATPAKVEVKREVASGT